MSTDTGIANISITLPAEVRKAWRSKKAFPAKVKAILLKGCLIQGAYIQAGDDVRLYGLSEALAYAKGYEKSGNYAAGTADKAYAAALKGPCSTVEEARAYLISTGYAVAS